MRALAAAVGVLVLAAAAHGKGVVSARACGADGCAKVATGEHTLIGGPAAPAPAAAEPFVRLEIEVGVPGHEESETLLFLPASGIMRFTADPDARWVHMEQPGPWRDAAAKVEPFPVLWIALSMW